MIGLNTVDNIVQRLFPHCERTRRGAHDGETEKGKCHDDTVESGSRIAFNLAEGSFSEEGKKVVHNL
jgi:hypothetical protein